MILKSFVCVNAGAAQVSTLLNKTAIDIVEAGKLEIFTPSYFFAARKK